MTVCLPKKIVELIDKDPVNIEFVKYTFSDARRVIIRDILNINTSHIPRTIVDVKDSDPAESLLKLLIDGNIVSISDDKKELVREAVKAGSKNLTKETILFSFRFLSEVNWKPGTFGSGTNGRSNLGEADSCFWQSRAGARRMIKNGGGIPITVYINGITPFARFFAVPYENDSFVIFNMYVTDQSILGTTFLNTLGTMANCLAEFLGDEYRWKHVKYTNQKSTTGHLWVNADGAAVAISKRDIYSNINTNIPTADYYRCRNCSTVITNDEDVIRDGNDQTYCEECAESKLEFCNYSSLMYDKSYMVKGPDNKFYYTDNISKVKEFVIDYETKEYIFKKDAKQLSSSVWVKKTCDKGLCKSCGMLSVVNDNGICMSCAPDEELISALDLLGIDIFNMNWKYPEDNEKLNKFVNLVSERMEITYA